jgi:inosine-uridine nucleoside N-ribohydrolase
MKHEVIVTIVVFLLCVSFTVRGQSATPNRLRVILDTDANNELDDQHAIAYLLFSSDAFYVEGITVNRTRSGGDIENHVEEAIRIVKLCALHPRIEVSKGASASFDEIQNHLDETDFDGYEAVNLIIQKSHQPSDQRLILLPVGKLTNIALALKKDPKIIPRVRVVWLGSNYPEPGEYNQDNDESALNYILNTDVAFEIALVRYGKDSGTAAVTVSLANIRQKMRGLGPHIQEPVTGRHGGQYTCFGDYSINLFENIDLHGEDKVRSLFDMAAVAIVKNPTWATASTIPAPILVQSKWKQRLENPRKIVLWENFDREAIMADFYDTVENASQSKHLRED